jgi:hypothetical protein
VRRAAALLLTLAALAVGVPTAAPVAAASRPFAEGGTWVSIFSGDYVWDHPERHVRRMHRHGVHTLFLQTASSTNPVGTDLYRPSQLARFIVAAHARGMRVVAWYLPPMRRVAREHERAMAAIRFRTVNGQRFDGFALDIEPSASTPKGQLRNDNLRRLSRRIRESAGPTYRLGAIIPSPRGMAVSTKFWPAFPYDTVGAFYDVVMPMSYHTYRVKGAAATYTYTMDNIAFLRSAIGPDVALHMIGGEAGASNDRETDAFVRACNDARVTGASIWHYGSYGPEDWSRMSALNV